MKLSLKKKFLVPTISATVLCLAVISIVSFMKSSKAIENLTSEQVKYVSVSLSKQVTNWINERKNDLVSFTQEDVFKNAVASSDAQALITVANQRLTAIAKANTLFEFIALAGPDGSVIASSVQNQVGSMNLAEREYFKESMAGNIAISDVIISKGSGNPVFVISSPVTVYGKIKGVLLNVIEMNQFAAAFIDSERVGETGYVYMMNDQGKVIAYPDKSKILNLDLSTYDFGRQMLEQKNGLLKYTFKEIDKIVAFSTEHKTGWIIASTANNSELFKPIHEIRNISIVVSSIGVILITGMLFFITQSIVRPINQIIKGMEEGANMVASAAGQISSSSQSMAEGASEQAAAIEETSSSMEEMASMTSGNAENAGNADGLMRNTNQVVSEANTSMNHLMRSMTDISQAGEETSKIIKTIDEIAFQTNLLALNAAVEAARAGEAGTGFAVVADEVRNLSMRAADAAKDTAELIEGIVKKIHDGTELVSNTHTAFEKVTESSDNVTTLIGEIAQASKEQSEGINQVNVSISEMDKVVQQNSSNAEESASASEEMSTQAEQLREYVGELVSLVSGEKKNHTNAISHSDLKAISHLEASWSKKNIKKERLLPRKNEIRPGQVITFEEKGDFKDF